MRFGVLGPLTVWTDDGVVVSIPGAKVRTLLAVLLSRRDRLVSADRLVEDLWGAQLPGNPAGALQAKVSQLRRALDEAEPGARATVASQAPGYALRVDSAAVDAERFAAVCARARDCDDPAQAAALWEEALAMWRGPAWAEFADFDFARADVRQLDEQRLTAQEGLLRARLELGGHDAVAADVEHLLAEHPRREKLRAVHMTALYRAGRQSDSLDSYAQLRTLLREELGLDPSRELSDLYHSILHQDSQLDTPSAGAPDTAAGAPPCTRPNLPEPLTSLVGRDEAVADVCTLLDQHRLVTLTGVGGVGKTRMAVEVARRLADGATHTVAMAELADVDAVRPHDGGPSGQSRTLEQLAEIVAVALCVRDDVAAAEAHPAEGSVDKLVNALRTDELTLILDNCEHVADPAAELAAQLLGTVPGLRILATSRQPLEIPGEALWTVSPLPPPDVDAPLAEIAQSSAVQMFVARAAAAVPGFGLDADNCRAAAAVCRQLDGLPLALELAATRVRMLGVHDLAVRLRDRFGLLGATRRDASGRQQTLRSMIDWSWELLSPVEQAVLRRLSAHADGCTLDSAETVCTGGSVAASQVFDALAGLVDRSLAVSAEAAGGRRFRLLETVAAYCRERLDEAGETQQTRRRHAQHYARMAAQADPGLRGPRQRQWMDQLDAESANLNAALHWSIQDADADTALHLVNAMAWRWFLRGQHREALRWFTEALQLRPDGDDEVTAHARTWAAVMRSSAHPAADVSAPIAEVLAMHDRRAAPEGRAYAQMLFSFAVVNSHLPGVDAQSTAEAVKTFRRSDDRWNLAAALTAQAERALAEGDLTAAEQSATESAELFAEIGDRWRQAQPSSILGALAAIAGDYDRALALHQDALCWAEDGGLTPLAVQELGRLGRLSLLRGDFEVADEYHRRALRMSREIHSDGGVDFAEGGLAMSARRRGHLDRAEELMRRSLQRSRNFGYDTGVAFALCELGFIAEQRGDGDAALQLHAEGMEIAHGFDDPRAMALAAEGMAGAQALRKQPKHAAALLGSADAARRAVDKPLPAAERHDVDRIGAAVRDQLSRADVEAAFTAGGRASPVDVARRRPG